MSPHRTSHQHHTSIHCRGLIICYKLWTTIISCCCIFVTINGPLHAYIVSLYMPLVLRWTQRFVACAFPSHSFAYSADHFACVCHQIEIRMSQCVILKVIKVLNVQCIGLNASFGLCPGNSTVDTPHSQRYHVRCTPRERYDMFDAVRPVEGGTKRSYKLLMRGWFVDRFAIALKINANDE